MTTCSKCGTPTTSYTTVFGSNGLPTRHYCRVCKPRQNPATAANPWEGGFTLQHVKDEQGRNVVVNSTRELREAEKRYNFALAVMSDTDSSASNPPQHESWAGDIAHNYEKKWNTSGSAYSSAEIAKASQRTGVARSADETLVNRPNPV